MPEGAPASSEKGLTEFEFDLIVPNIHTIPSETNGYLLYIRAICPCHRQNLFIIKITYIAKRR